jgi:hypothetical protein
MSCSRSSPRSDADAAASLASTPSVAGTVTDASASEIGDSAGLDAGVAKAPCGPSVLQPNACISSHADLTLDRAAIRAWFRASDVVTNGHAWEWCRDVSFGPAAEHVLLCIRMDERGMSGFDGPWEHLYDLEILAARNKRRVELLRVPFGFSMTASTYNDYAAMLFSARYSLDEDAGTLDVDVAHDECVEAHAGIRRYWDERSAAIRSNASVAPPDKLAFIRLYDLERPAASERIAAVCRAAGHYVRSGDGHLAKTRK